MLRQVLLYIACIFLPGELNAQYDWLRFPQSTQEIAFNKQHRIKSVKKLSVWSDDTTNLTKDDSTVTIESFDIYGRLVSEERNSKNGLTITTYKYDEAGKLYERSESESYEYSSGTVMRTTIYRLKYHDNGFLKKVSRKKPGGVLFYTEDRFKYHKKENKLTTRNPSETYYYNYKQLPAKSVKKNYQGGIQTRYFQYDYKGNITQDIFVYQSEDKYDSTVRESIYNDFSNPEKIESYEFYCFKNTSDLFWNRDKKNTWDTAMVRYVYEYGYDNDGRTTFYRKTIYDSAQKSPVVIEMEQTSEFISENGLITETCTEKVRGIVRVRIQTKQYNERGLIVYMHFQPEHGTTHTVEKYYYTFY